MNIEKNYKESRKVISSLFLALGVYFGVSTFHHEISMLSESIKGKIETIQKGSPLKFKRSNDEFINRLSWLDYEKIFNILGYSFSEEYIFQKLNDDISEDEMKRLILEISKKTSSPISLSELESLNNDTLVIKFLEIALNGRISESFYQIDSIANDEISKTKKQCNEDGYKVIENEKSNSYIYGDNEIIIPTISYASKSQKLSDLVNLGEYKKQFLEIKSLFGNSKNQNEKLVNQKKLEETGKKIINEIIGIIYKNFIYQNNTHISLSIYNKISDLDFIMLMHYMLSEIGIDYDGVEYNDGGVGILVNFGNESYILPSFSYIALSGDYEITHQTLQKEFKGNYQLILPSNDYIKKEQIERVILSHLYLENSKKNLSPENQILLDTAIYLSPNNWQAYYYNSIYLYEQGNYYKALYELEKVREINPNFTEYYNLKGNIYSFLGEDKKAIEMFDILINAGTNEYGPYFNKALSLMKLGDYNSARENFDLSYKYYLKSKKNNVSGDSNFEKTYKKNIQKLQKLLEN